MDVAVGLGMTKRSAPKNGYARHGSKAMYRRQVWNTFREHCPLPISQAHVLLLPSSEGDEIAVAINKGFKESHIHAVDRNPAIVAHIKRRYPQVRTYGRDVKDVGSYINEQIVCANLDLCSEISRGLFNTITEFITSGCLHPQALIGVTVQRGREKNETNSWMKDLPPVSDPDGIGGLSDNDTARQSFITAALHGEFAPHETEMTVRETIREYLSRPVRVVTLNNGIYKSPSAVVSMLWEVSSLHKQPCLCHLCNGFEQTCLKYLAVANAAGRE